MTILQFAVYLYTSKHDNKFALKLYNLFMNENKLKIWRDKNYKRN